LLFVGDVSSGLVSKPPDRLRSFPDHGTAFLPQVREVTLRKAAAAMRSQFVALLNQEVTASRDLITIAALAMLFAFMLASFGQS
jgi:hypothetical protein